MLPRPAGLASKYTLWITALVGSLLVISGASSLVFSWREIEAHVIALQKEKARAAAADIQQFVTDIERHIGWTLLPLGVAAAAPTAAPVPSSPTGNAAERAARRLEFLKMLRHSPAIAEAAWIDPQGLEQVRVARMTPDAQGAGVSRRADPAFTQTTVGRTWRSGVNFRGDSEPFLRIARRAGSDGGVTVADINLKFVWEVVSALQLGPQGVAYVVDHQGSLIAHPDLSRVLRKTDMGSLPQVSRALRLQSTSRGMDAGIEGPSADERAHNLAGVPVLAASARIEPLGWTVLVETPLTEAMAPLAASAWRLAAVLLAGLVLSALASALLARSLARPIRALQDGADRIGAGDLEHRIQLATRDEVQALAERFNQMAANLQANVTQLESRVAERTLELAQANEAKSRFIAAASHDLRQPVHALGLFAGQLRGVQTPAARRELLHHIEQSVAAFEALLEALLDISRLDAGTVVVRAQAMPLRPLLERLVRGQAAAASHKGLRLGLRVGPNQPVQPNSAAGTWVTSDAVLLERILNNLLGNALRYTRQGGVLIAARLREGQLLLRIIDTGSGIAQAQLPLIFQEFYRVPGHHPGTDPGLGLGLAIVRRLTDLLGHRLEVRSRPGHGTVFDLWLPLAQAQTANASPASTSIPFTEPAADPLRARRVLVIDDDQAVREGMRGQLQQWGLDVLLAADEAQAWAAFAHHGQLPDAVISDLRLADGADGLSLALRLKERHSVPIAIVSGETAAASVQAVRDAGLPWLAKPLRPAHLRAQLEAMLRASDGAAGPP